MEGGKDPIQAHAEFLAENMEIPNVPNMVLLILYDLRIPVNCAGFRFLKDVLPAAFRNPSQIVESELFDCVGSQYLPEVSIRNMDFAIRDVLKKAWKDHNNVIW